MKGLSIGKQKNFFQKYLPVLKLLRINIQKAKNKQNQKSKEITKMKTTINNIKAQEINENEIDKAVGGAIVYNNGNYDVVSGETLIGSYRNYTDACWCAQAHGISNQYFSSKREYANWLYPAPVVTYSTPVVTYSPVVYDYNYDFFIDEYGDIWVF